MPAFVLRRFPDREPTDEDSASFTARGSTCRAGQIGPSTPQIRLADVRAREKLFRRTGEHDAAALEDVTAARHGERHARVLLDDEHGGPEGAVDLADALEHRQHEARGEAERGLVEEEEPWPAHQSPSDREHLLLAARELPAEDAPEPAQIRKQIEDLLQILDAGPPRGSQAQVLLYRQTGKDAAPFRHVGDTQADEGLWLRAMDRRAGKGDRASLGPHQAGDGAQRGRLAGSIRAEERDDLSFAHLEGHAAQRADAAVRGVDVFEDEEGLLPGGRATRRQVRAFSQIRLDYHRILQYLRRRPLRDPFTKIEDGDRLRHLRYQRHVVLDEQHGETALAEAVEQDRHLHLLGLVEPRCGLVEEEQVHLASERPSDLDQLLRAVREVLARRVRLVG